MQTDWKLLRAQTDVIGVVVDVTGVAMNQPTTRSPDEVAEVAVVGLGRRRRFYAVTVELARFTCKDQTVAL